eukprot:Nk52_evm19s684 gene=Nk52_evmTU19s684
MRNGCGKIPERYYYKAQQQAETKTSSRGTKGMARNADSPFRIVVTRQRMSEVGICYLRRLLEYYKDRGYHIIFFEQLRGPTVRSDCKRILKIDKDPEIIAFHYLQEVEHRWKDISSHPAYKFAWLHDLNYPEHINSAIKYSRSWLHATFPTYAETFTDLVSPEVYKGKPLPMPKCFVISNAAPDEFIREQRYDKFSSKVKKALLSGSVSKKWYSLRYEGVQLIKQNFPLIERVAGSGAGLNGTDPSANAVAYSKLINKYRLAIAGSTDEEKRRPYILAKTFEIPASGTAMIHDLFMVPYLREEGFEPYVHYIPATVETLSDVIEEWLQPEKEEKLKEITFAGQRLVMERHLQKHKFNGFLNFVEDQHMPSKRRLQGHVT